jgi:hypothetical protein
MLALAFASCKKDQVEEPTEPSELANPFANIEIPENLTLTELVQTENGDYVSAGVKNIYDVELFVNMLKQCKFYPDSENRDAVELSHLVEFDDVAFFVSTDLSRIYFSLSEPVGLMQQDVEPYRVEGFGEIEWELLLETRGETTGILKQLEGAVGFDILIGADPSQRYGEIKRHEYVKEFYSVLRNSIKNEAETQADEIYKYYFSLNGYNFKLSDDLGGYRYMCEVSEKNVQDSPIKLEEIKTFKIEGISEDFISRLKNSRTPSFFRMLRYMDLTELSSSFAIRTENDRYSLKYVDLYRLLSLFENCEYELVGNCTKSDLNIRGYYFDMSEFYYDFYISEDGRTLVCCNNSDNLLISKDSLVYKLSGFDMNSFEKIKGSIMHISNNSFEFWNKDMIFIDGVVD